MKITIGRIALALSLASVLVLAGCGGGGSSAAASGSGGTGGSGSGGSGGSGSGGSGGSGSGGTLSGASVTINWPARTRALNSPASALSAEIVFKAASPGGVDIKVDANRDTTQLGAYTGTYPLPSSIVTSTVQMTVNFYSQAGRQGSMVGTAAATVQASSSSLSLGAIDVTDLVRSVSVIGPVAFNPKAGPTQLQFQANDTQKNILALTPGSATWSVVSGTAATITADGILTPKAKGSVTVKVTVDGLSSTQIVNVSQYAGNPFYAIAIPYPPGALSSSPIYLNNNGVVANIGADSLDIQSGFVRKYYVSTFTEAGGTVLLDTVQEPHSYSLDGFDDAGDLIGTANTQQVVGHQTVTWEAGTAGVKKIFPTLESKPEMGNYCIAEAPNGLILGVSRDDSSDAYQPQLFTAASTSVIPQMRQQVDPQFWPGTAFFTPGVSMNNSGAFVAGNGYYSSASSQAVTLAAPSVQGTLNTYSASRINNNGTMVGEVSYYPAGGHLGTVTAGVIWQSPNDPNPQIIVPPPGFTFAIPVAINDNNVVVGGLVPAAGDDLPGQHWFIKDSTGIYAFTPDIGSIPARVGMGPVAINNSGLILGLVEDFTIGPQTGNHDTTIQGILVKMH